MPVRVSYSTNHDPKPGDRATTKAQAKAVIAKQSGKASPVKAARPPKGGGGRRGGRGGRGGGGALSIPQLANMEAGQQIQASEQPILDQIAQEKAMNLQKAQAQMGFSKAAAAIMQNAAPAIGNAYTNAANADAGYAQGLGGQVQQNLNQNQSQDNAFLQQMGTPSGALQQAAPVGQVAYGLQGYVPASTLQREGAGFESAAQLMPGDLLSAGQQQSQQILSNDPQMLTLQNELAKVAATQPEAYQKILTALNDQAYKQQEIQLGYGRLAQGQQRVGIAQQNANTSQFRAQNSVAQGWQRVAQGQVRLSQAAKRMANQNAQAWARIGIEKGKFRLQAATAEAKLQASMASGGTAGFTPSEVASLKKRARPMALGLYNGTYVKDIQGNIQHVPPASYKFAMKEMVASGIPPSLADHELRAAGYRPGDGRGTPKENPFANIGSGFGGGSGAAPLGLAGIKDPVERQAAGTIVQQAYHYLGTPYVWGGESPKGFDCSGFAQYLYQQAGINIPRTTYTQWQTGFSVPQNKLEPGDLVFFRGSDSRGGLPGHVGIYIGGGKMIDAPHTGASVRIESVGSFGGYMGARRYR